MARNFEFQPSSWIGNFWRDVCLSMGRWKGNQKKKKRQEQVVEYIELARDKIEPAREAIGEMTEIL